MHSVGIKLLKNRLSEYVHAAAEGETVLVTDRGRIVAELIAPRVPADASPDERRLGELARQGLLALPKRRCGDAPALVPVASLDQLMTELDADREDR